MKAKRKIIEYQILHGGSTKQISEEVSRAINAGYSLYGSPFGGRSDAACFDYFQAIVKMEILTSQPSVQPEFPKSL